MSEIDEKFGSIATKVSAESKRQLDQILKRMGMNYYEWFQLMAEVTIRIADDRHNLSEQMLKMIQMFSLVPGWKNPATFCDPNAPCEVRAAVYMVQQQGKRGLKPVMTERGWFDGIWNQTENVQDIVEYVIEQCMPTSYKWLRQHMTDLECNRVFECLMLMADAATTTKLDEEIAQMFGDNQRSDYGKEIMYGLKSIGYKHRTPDSLHNAQQHIQFNDFDRETGVGAAFGTGTDSADAVEEAISGKPFDQEP